MDLFAPGVIRFVRRKKKNVTQASGYGECFLCVICGMKRVWGRILCSRVSRANYFLMVLRVVVSSTDLKGDLCGYVGVSIAMLVLDEFSKSPSLINMNSKQSYSPLNWTQTVSKLIRVYRSYLMSQIVLNYSDLCRWVPDRSSRIWIVWCWRGGSAGLQTSN